MSFSTHATTTTLSEVIEIRSSLTDPRSAENRGLPHVSPEHIASGSGVIDWSIVNSCEQDRVISGKYAFQPGDIIYSKIRPILNKVAIADRYGLCSADMYALTVKEGCDVSFIYNYLQTPEFISYAAALSGRANIPKINREQLLGSAIALPPILSQQRIAAILDKINALLRKRQRALELLDGLIMSVFLEMFGDPRATSKRWAELDFDKACSDVTAKSAKLQRADYLNNGRFPVVDQGQNLIAGWSDGDDLVTRVDRPVTVFGDHTRIVKFVDFDFIVGADGAKLIKPSAAYEPLFFTELLRRMPIPDLGYSRHMRVVKKLSFPCPPLSLQETFAQRCSIILKVAEKHGGNLRRLEALFASLQHGAFTGQL